ncbi:MAG TPA: universal stress protein [Chthoniobacter sp.]|nr:universal stress protein [Chthoniobacter sp.]
MKTILVPVDFSDVTPEVVETARKLAAAFEGRLVILNIAEPEPDFVGFEAGPPSVRIATARDFRVERQRLDDIKTQLSSGGSDVTALHIQGPIVEKILHEAGEQQADLIVIGSHGHGAFYDLLVGSVTHGIIKEARCPVVVVPAANKH